MVNMITALCGYFSGTFVSDTGGTFKSDTPGTFVSDIGGTFEVILSPAINLQDHTQCSTNTITGTLSLSSKNYQLL